MDLHDGAAVSHPRLGTGTVIVDRGETAVVRFSEGIHECEKAELTRLSDARQTIRSLSWEPAEKVVARVQAECITSVNDAWGVFSRSSIALLPHQLWVCKQVNERWPTRWLVADDVGLGKTIEAGLILMPLLSRGTVRRLLVMCPASLVSQWQARLIDMFDIRLAPYSAEHDTARSRFWAVHPQVVASFHTLRDDRKGRHQRLFETGPWDMVIVDEAHHVNYDEKEGPTGAYSLVERMVEQELIRSMVFFTGTPHRGKPFGFLALLQLLRPDLFDRDCSMTDQLSHLAQVLIRNNKYTVTDLRGQRLFQHPRVERITYRYSPEEEHFYNLLTEFIETGRAYASTQDVQTQKAVMLVLIAMQKLASSSIAAIRRAIAGRLQRLKDKEAEMRTLHVELARLEQAEEYGDDDEANSIQEALVATATQLKLMEDEQDHLQTLLDAADRVRWETKIEEILRLLDGKLAGRSVLFFTEYKATQSLLLSALNGRFGDECGAFINGDDRAEGVYDTAGKPRTLRQTRFEAADRFNAGGARFLVSTEAGGEGIDLQEACHTLVHVDLPWNPMRMQQRLGRLNRYGQKEKVDVCILQNPDTVESRIWEKLDEKIHHIEMALSQVMEEPEDLQALILGMTTPRAFHKLFASGLTLKGERRKGDSFARWFDRSTGFFGGQDAVQTVKDLVGNCTRFDFQTVLPQLPRVDLPDLKPFVLRMLSTHKRRVTDSADGISFKTPDPWLVDFGVRHRYEDMIFDRRYSGRDARNRVLGVGHRLVDAAIAEARGHAESAACLPLHVFPSAVFVYRIQDRVTAMERVVKHVIAGIRITDGGSELISDWQLLLLLNQIDLNRLGAVKPDGVQTGEVQRLEKEASDGLMRYLPGLELPFRRPEAQLIAFLWPAASG